MRVLIDTNIILDFLQEREPFTENAARLFASLDSGVIEGYITATTITNIYYIVRKSAGKDAAQDAVKQILMDLKICSVDQNVLRKAIALNFRDFEDAVQYVCALVYCVDAIVTRDASGFVDAEIPVVLPEDIDTLR